MKAKVKATNEIVDVFHLTQRGQITGLYKELTFLEGRMWTEDELDFNIDDSIQFDSIESAIKRHAETYSFNIKSALFPTLTEEQQKLWKKDIEWAIDAGTEFGLELANDKKYKI